MALQTTGYQALPQTVSWTGQGVNSLTDNEWTDLSDEIVNSTGKYVNVDVRIALGSAAFTGADSTISMYVVPTLSDTADTNYPNWTGNVTTDEQHHNQYFADNATTSGATEAQEIVIRNIILPPGRFKFAFRNTTNVTLNASNTVAYRPHSFEDV